jgi:hypothetical protein
MKEIFPGPSVWFHTDCVIADNEQEEEEVSRRESSSGLALL